MAFTSTIKPYKFVNPSSISVKGGGATIIAGGKTITGGMTPQVKSARVTMLAINRIGMAMEGLGKTQQQIRDIIVYENKYLAQSSAFKKKREGYRRDQKSEAQSESFGKKEQEGVAKEVEKKEKKKLGWLEKIFGPFAGIIAFVGRVVITQTVLRWVGDPKNTDKLTVFVKSFSKVFKWAFNIAYKSTDAVLTGFAKVFGSSDKKGLDRFGEVLGGLGQLLIGIAGFKALGYLLNPFSLVNDIIGLIDILSARGPGGGGGAGGGGKPGTQKPQLGKGAQKVAENYGDDAARYYDDLIKRGKKPGDALKAVRGKFNKLPPPPKTIAGKMKQGFLTQVDSLKKFGSKIKGFAVKGFNIGAGVFKKGKELVGSTGNWIKASGNQLKTLAAAAKDPEMLKHLVNKMVAEKVKPAIEKNAGAKKLLQVVSDPKNLRKNIGPLIKDALKSKQALDTVKYLKGVQQNAKIGGIDKVIAALTALFDYGVMGTPFANAFLGALGGLLGYSGGFALGAPFGGFPGFVAGAAGGIAGEAIGRGLARMLGKGVLGKTADPLMNDGRMLADPELAEGGITTKATRAILGEKGPEAVVPLSKLGGGGALASTLIGATQSALSRMGAAGEIAKSLIGGDLAEAQNLFGVTPVGAAGGDSLGKSVIKASKRIEEIDAGSDISIYLGSDNVIIKDRKEGGNKAITLRGQLANVLSALIWVSKKDIRGGSSGGTPSSNGDPSAAPSGPVEPLQVSGGQKGAFKKIYDIAKQVGDPVPELTAAQAMFESGWLTSLGAKMDNNPFGQTGSGDAGKVWSNGRYWARYRTLNSAVKSHVDRWANGTPAGGPGYASKGGAPMPGLMAILETYAPGSENNHGNYTSAVRRNLVTFGFDPNKKNPAKQLAKGGRLWKELHGIDQNTIRDSITVKNSARSAPDKSPQKFALGGNYKNGEIPESALAPIRGGGKLRKEVAGNFNSMWDAAKAAGHSLSLTSSYRSYADQVRVYKQYGSPRAAKPGTSPHSWGLAVDLGYSNAAYKWLRQNSKKYGFNQIPGLETDNPNGFEAWHWQVGTGRPGGATVPNAPGPESDQQQSGPGGNAPQEPPETLDSLMAKLQSAVGGLNQSLGYSPPSIKKPDSKPGANTPSGSAPSVPSTAPAPTASSSGSSLSQASENIARLEEAAADSNQPAQIIPLPINSGTTQLAYGSGVQVYTPKTPITYGI